MKKLEQIKDKFVIGLNFVLDGDAIIYVSNRVLLTSGRIAEAILLFSVLWITAHYVEHTFFASVIPQPILTTCDVSALLSLALLPEIILYRAIVTVVNHTSMTIKNVKSLSTVWTVLFGLPTLAFVIMTLSVFWHIAFDDTGFLVTIQADRVTMFIRILSSWFYFLVSLIYNQVSTEKNVIDKKEKVDTKIVKRKSVDIIEVDNTKLLDSPKIETDNIEKSLTGKAAIVNFLSELTQDDRQYWFDRRQELADKFSVGWRTADRAFDSHFPEFKKKA